MVEVVGHRLCLEHYEIFERVQREKLESLERQEINTLFSMAWTVGSPELYMQAEERRKALEKKKPDIHVSGSTIGAINTGTVVGNLSVQMKTKIQTLSQGSDTTALVEALRKLTEAVQTAPNLTAEKKVRPLSSWASSRIRR